MSNPKERVSVTGEGKWTPNLRQLELGTNCIGREVRMAAPLSSRAVLFDTEQELNSWRY